jgi:hypothetical protein
MPFLLGAFPARRDIHVEPEHYCKHYSPDAVRVKYAVVIGPDDVSASTYSARLFLALAFKRKLLGSSAHAQGYLN